MDTKLSKSITHILFISINFSLFFPMHSMQLYPTIHIKQKSTYATSNIEECFSLLFNAEAKKQQFLEKMFALMIPTFFKEFKRGLKIGYLYDKKLIDKICIKYNLRLIDYLVLNEQKLLINYCLRDITNCGNTNVTLTAKKKQFKKWYRSVFTLLLNNYRADPYKATPQYLSPLAQALIFHGHPLSLTLFADFQLTIPDLSTLVNLENKNSASLIKSINKNISLRIKKIELLLNYKRNIIQNTKRLTWFKELYKKINAEYKKTPLIQSCIIEHQHFMVQRTRSQSCL